MMTGVTYAEKSVFLTSEQTHITVYMEPQTGNLQTKTD